MAEWYFLILLEEFRTSRERLPDLRYDLAPVLQLLLAQLVDAEVLRRVVFLPLDRVEVGNQAGRGGELDVLHLLK